MGFGMITSPFGWAYDNLKQALSCLCCMCIIGPILILIGVLVFMSAFDNTRKKDIDLYNAQVDLWTSTGRADFDKASFDGSVNPGFPFTVKKNTATDELNDDGDEFTTYQALKWMTESSVTLFANANYDENAVGSVTVEVNNGTSTADLLFAPRLFSELRKTPSDMGNCRTTVEKKDSNDKSTYCGDECSSRDGVWDTTSNVCKIKSKVTHICVKVSKDEFGQWALNNSYGGIGCEPGPNNWDPSYKMETLKSTQTTNIALPVVVYVRSADDPYVYAAYITNGSYDFGLTTAEKITIALILIIIGAMFMCCTCGLAFFFYRSYNNRGGRRF